MRRNWKRILSLLLTVAMVFTMNTSVFAATDYNSSNLSDDVTFNNGDTYTAADGTVATYKVAEGETTGKWYVGETAYDSTSAVEEAYKTNDTANEPADTPTKRTVYKYNDKYYTVDGTEVTDYSEDKYTLSDETVRSLTKVGDTFYEVTKVDGKVTKVEKIENATDLEKALATSAEKVPEEEGDKTTVYAVNGEYYTANGTKVEDYSEGSDKYTLSDETVRSLISVGDKFYAVTRNDDDKITAVEEITDATELEKVLATSADKKPEVEVIVEDGEGNAEIKNAYNPVNYGWKLVKDGADAFENDTDKFAYDTDKKLLSVNAALVREGYYLQATTDAAEAKIQVGEFVGSTYVTNYTVSVSGIKDGDGKGTGQAVKIETEGNTMITVSADGTRVFKYTKSSPEYADATITNAIATGAVDQTGEQTANLRGSADELYLAFPQVSTTIAAVSFNEAGDNTNKFKDGKNTVKYEGMDFVVAGNTGAGADISVIPSKENKVWRAVVTADQKTHNIFGITEDKDRKNITIYKTVVQKLSENGITKDVDMGDNEIYLAAHTVKTSPESTISVSYDATTKGAWVKDYPTMNKYMEISLVSGNITNNVTMVDKDHGLYYIQTPKTVELGSSVAKDAETQSFGDLQGNTEYIPIVRTVSAASSQYLADGVLYIPSEWIYTNAGAKTRPAAGVLPFKAEIKNIGKTTASVNIAVANTDDYMLAGIYVTDTKTAPTTSENAGAAESKWIISDNKLNADGNWVEVKVGSGSPKEAVGGVAKLNDVNDFTFSVSSNNGLEAGKLYYVYAMGYLKTDGVAMKTENMIFGSTPIATFGTVKEYGLTAKVDTSYEGENFSYDKESGKITVGAHYYGDGINIPKNPFANLQVAGFSMTVLNEEGQEVVLDKASLTAIVDRGGKYMGIDKDALAKYLVMPNLNISNPTYASTILPAIKTIGFIKKGDEAYQPDENWDKTGNYALSSNDIGATNIKYSLCIEEDEAGTKAIYAGIKDAANYDVSVVKTNLYAYPEFIYEKGTTISNGSISVNGIKYNVGRSTDTDAPTANFNYKDVNVTGDAFSAFQLVRVDATTGKETVVQKFSSSTKFPLSIAEGEYRLQLIDVSKLTTDSNMTGYNFTIAPAGDYTKVTNPLDYKIGLVKDNKGSYPYVKVSVDPTGKGKVNFTITRNADVPIAYGTMSANDLKEDYLKSAFKATLVNTENTNYNYATEVGFKQTYIKFTKTKAEAQKVVDAASQNKLTSFRSLKDEVKLESVQAGTTVYAVMLVSANNANFYKYFGLQAAVAPVTVGKRAVTLSWNGGTAKTSGTKYTYGSEAVIASIGRGDADTLKEGVTIAGDESQYFTFYAQDASGNAIKGTAGNGGDWASVTGATAVNGGYKLASTGEVISPAIFAVYNYTTGANVVGLPGNKGISYTTSTTYKLNTSNVDVTTTSANGYNVTLQKLPTLSTNNIAITTGSGSSAVTTTYNAFGKNFEVKTQDIKIVITPRTTVTFKATYSYNGETKTIDNQYVVNDTAITDAGVKLSEATFTETEASTVRNTFLNNTTDASVIFNKTANAVGKGTLAGVYITGWAKVYSDTASENKGRLLDYTDTPTKTLADVTIYKDKDVVVEAKIEVDLTSAVVVGETADGENLLKVSSIQPVVYDGRAHVIAGTVLKYNLTSKVNDIVLNVYGGKDGDTQLTVNKDYKVSYKNNTNANVVFDENGKMSTTNKQPQVIVTGIGDYKGLKLTANFNIVANDLEEEGDISTGKILTEIGYPDNDGVASESSGKEIIVINDYIRVANDKTGTLLKPKFQIERTFTSGVDKTTVKKVTLKKSEYTASIYDADGKYVGPLATTKIKNTLTEDKPQSYFIRVTGKGNYQGTIEKEVKVFKKSSTKLLDNATVTWAKLSGLKYTDSAHIKTIVDSVKMKDGSKFSVANGTADAKANYALKLEYKSPTGKTFYTKEWETTTGYDWDFNAVDVDNNNDGVELLPGTYKATLIENEDYNGDDKVYGETKAKTFKVAALKLPEISFVGHVTNGKQNTDNATSEVSGKSSKAFGTATKNYNLDYTGYSTTLVEKVDGGKAIAQTNGSKLGDYYVITYGEKHNRVIPQAPGKYKFTVVGQKQYLGNKKTYTITRSAATLKTAMKDMGFDIVVVEKPKQNVNGAMFNAVGDEGFYFTFLGENVGKRMTGAGGTTGTTRWWVDADYDKNIEYVYFNHIVSQNEAHKGETYWGVLRLKFSNNTKVSDKAKVTITGLATDPTTKEATGSFVTGGGLSTTYSIVADTVLIDTAAPANTNIHKYDALAVAKDPSIIKAGHYYYTAEDVAENSKGVYKPKFKLYQAQQGPEEISGKVKLNTKKAIATSDYTVDASLSANEPKKIKGLELTLEANPNAKVTNYNFKTNAAAEADKREGSIVLDGVYIYDTKVNLNTKTGLTLKYATAPTGTALNNETIRLLNKDSKDNLVYTYNGLYVDIGNSFESMILNAGKEGDIEVKSGSTTGVNSTVANAIEVIDLKPNYLAQTEGSYTATVRIRPDVVNNTAAAATTAGTQYGGTVTIKFKVNAMDKDLIKL